MSRPTESVQKLLLLVQATTRDSARWARRHLYAWLVLAPLVLGLTYFTASSLAEDLLLVGLSRGVGVAIAAGGWLALVGLSLSRATSELFHVGRPEAYFDSLPISADTSLKATLAIRMQRLMAAAFILIAGRSLVVSSSDLLSGQALLSLVLLIALTSVAEVLGALNWIHWTHLRRSLGALIAVVILLGASAPAGALAVAVLSPRPFVSLPRVQAASAVLALSLYWLVRHQHKLWRRADAEYARRLRGAGGGGPGLPKWLAGRLGASGSAQLLRDVTLTVRGFSSAVYVVGALGVLWAAALFFAIGNLVPIAPNVGEKWLDATWLPQVMAIKVGCVLQTCTMAALVPVIVGYELPYLWLERAIGTTGLEVWNAKLWYARMISLPGCLLICFSGAATLTTPVYYALPLLAECLWLWWLISSLVGALAFEMPTRPALALVFMMTIGLGAGAITALAWPAGLLTYAQAMHALTKRGRQRARYYLVTEGE